MLLEKISEHHGAHAADTILRFFEAASLPIPAEGEFLASSDSGALIFLEDQACVIRLASPHLTQNPYIVLGSGISFEPVVHRHVLQPFGLKRLNDNLFLELVPGVKVGCSSQEYRIMSEKLTADHFEINDGCMTAERNGGQLPDGTAVIIDRGAVSVLHNSVRAVASELAQQEKYFGPLKEIFNKAWPESSDTAAKSTMNTLWDTCQKMKDDGLLVAGWDKKKFSSMRLLKPAP